MDRKRLATAIAGAILALLGALWFLQGAGIIDVCPILCFADCGCVRGGSAFWVAAGAVAFILGITAISLALKRPRA